MRVVIADDEALFRDGLASLLDDAGVDVVAKVGTGPELLRKVELAQPDAAVVDIRMPPSQTDEGLLAAQEIRRTHPQVGVLVLSHYLESHWAMRLLEEHPGAPATCSRTASPTWPCSSMHCSESARANASSTRRSSRGWCDGRASTARSTS